MANTGEAKAFILMLMMLIGLAPMMFTYLNPEAGARKFKLSFGWLVFWWAIPFANMVTYVLRN